MKTSTILPIIIALGVVLGVLSFVLVQQRRLPSSVVVPADLLAPTPTYPPMQETVVVSPNGKAVLTMTEQDSAQGKTYTISAATEKGASPAAVFSKTVDYTNSIIIPFNTWSSDNRYLLLKESIGSESAYYVVHSSGELFASDEQFIPVSDLFMKRFSQYEIQDMTGWASPTLVVVNTKNKSGGKGPSFWFEVPSRGFIQLSTRFD